MSKSRNFGAGNSIRSGSISKQANEYGSGHVPVSYTPSVLKRKLLRHSSTAGVAKSSSCKQFGNSICYGTKSSPDIKSSSSILKLGLNIPNTNTNACTQDKNFPFVWGGFRISKC